MASKDSKETTYWLEGQEARLSDVVFQRANRARLRFKVKGTRCTGVGPTAINRGLMH